MNRIKNHYSNLPVASGDTRFKYEVTLRCQRSNGNPFRLVYNTWAYDSLEAHKDALSWAYNDRQVTNASVEKVVHERLVYS